MSTVNCGIVELSRAFRVAENLTRKRSPKAWLTLSFLVPRKRLRYLFLCYAYLRWVDDLIDDKAVSINEKKKNINAQVELVLSFCKEKKSIPQTIQEAFLFHFTSFAINNSKPQLITELESMLNSMKMDVQRLEHNGIFSKSELFDYISLQTGAMFGLVHSFIFPNDDYTGRYEKLGIFFWYAGTLRDFKKDLDRGYLNISKEDLIEYKINIDDYTRDENLQIWLKNKVAYLLELLDAEVKKLNEFPFKVRLFWSIGYPFYLHKIIRIKMYRYSFDYENKIQLLKEIKSAAASLLLGIKTVLKIVF